MQAASNAYKELMRRKWRNPLSYVRVTIGLINQQAQASGYIPETENYTYFSNLIRPMDNYQVTELYATCEQDYTPTDGSVYFLPRNVSDVVLNQGIVTEELLGTIEIRFPVAYDIKGLTAPKNKYWKFQLPSSDMFAAALFHQVFSCQKSYPHSLDARGPRSKIVDI